MDSYTAFDNKLDRFIDKYYKLSIIKGIILFTLLTALIVLAISYLEFLGWFNHSGRLFLFLFGLLSSLFILYYFFVIPILRYFGLLSRLTKRKTEEIIHHNFPEIKDYVLNVIELKDLRSNEKDLDLINASILQKIEYTSKFDFQDILSFKRLYPLLKYLFSVVVLYCLIFVLKPAIISEGSNRIIHFRQQYNKSLGYTILINETNLTVEKGEDFYFSIRIIGDNVPEYISYYIGMNEYLMTRKDNRNYNSSISNINKSFSFRVGNDQYKTPLFLVSVIQPPFLNDFSITIDYPEYTGKKDEVFKRIANLKAPIGSKITWEFECMNVDMLWINMANDSSLFLRNSNLFSFDSSIYESQYYFIKGTNNDLARELVPKSFIAVIPDLYPDISINQVFDNSDKKLVHFKGNIFDDYGLSKLFFVIDDSRTLLPINSNLNNQDFFFSYEFNSKEDKEFSYYFEVFDNDEINGNKSSRSVKYIFKVPDYNDLAEFKNKQNQDIFQKMEKSLFIAEEFKKDIENIKEKLYSEKLSAFEKQQLIEGLQQKQQTLEQLLKEFSMQNMDKNKQFDSFSEQNDELLKKQENIQKLLESIMTDEVKALLDELDKLNLEYNKSDLNKQLDKIDMNYQQLSEQLDKNLELLKKFEIEKDLENISKELNNISENQSLLAKNEIISPSTDSIELNDKRVLEKLDEQYKNILENNEKLDNPMKLEKFELEFQELNLNMEISEDKEKIDEEDRKSKNIENSKKSKELANKIQDMINNNRVNEGGENSETLRQILENLIYFSFSQESINESFNISSLSSPIFLDNIKNQKNLVESYSIIKDSLLALSKRTPELGSHISNKVYEIESGLFDIRIYLDDNNLSLCRLEQRKVLEISNDLILLLSESLKNMENSGEGSEGSSKKKNKPKQSKPSISEMRKSQETMKSQLESMIQRMKEGQGKNGKPSSEQLGKMLAQQEIFQQMLNQLQSESGVGKEFQKKLHEINQLLDQNKRDLIRSNIDQSTLFRQNQIVTRLLEAEKSEKERELDEERKSTEAEYYLISKPSELFELEKTKNNFNEILNSNSLKLNYFYKNKYQEYLKNLN